MHATKGRRPSIYMRTRVQSSWVNRNCCPTYCVLKAIPYVAEIRMYGHVICRIVCVLAKFTHEIPTSIILQDFKCRIAGCGTAFKGLPHSIELPIILGARIQIFNVYKFYHEQNSKIVIMDP